MSLISGSYSLSTEGAGAVDCRGAIVEKRATLGVVDCRFLRVLGTIEALQRSREEGAAKRDAPKVRGDLLVSRLNAEPDADMVHNAGRDSIPRDRTGDGRAGDRPEGGPGEQARAQKKKEARCWLRWEVTSFRRRPSLEPRSRPSAGQAAVIGGCCLARLPGPILKASVCILAFGQRRDML